jgi:bifunctional DNase/RNase
LEDDVYYARLILEAENEVMERKIVELDARPSDSVALAVRAEAPIYVVRSLWEQLPDVSQTLAELREQGMDIGGIGEKGGDDDDDEISDDEIPF